MLECSHTKHGTFQLLLPLNRSIIHGTQARVSPTCACHFFHIRDPPKLKLKERAQTSGNSLIQMTFIVAAEYMYPLYSARGTKLQNEDYAGTCFDQPWVDKLYLLTRSDQRPIPKGSMFRADGSLTCRTILPLDRPDRSLS